MLFVKSENCPIILEDIVKFIFVIIKFPFLNFKKSVNLQGLFYNLKESHFRRPEKFQKYFVKFHKIMKYEFLFSNSALNPLLQTHWASFPNATQLACSWHLLFTQLPGAGAGKHCSPFCWYPSWHAHLYEPNVFTHLMFSPKKWNFGKNRIFGKNLNVDQKINFNQKSKSCLPKSKFWSKIQILIKN